MNGYYNIPTLPHKTAEELENHYYMANNQDMANLWAAIQELEEAWTN